MDLVIFVLCPYQIALSWRLLLFSHSLVLFVTPLVSLPTQWHPSLRAMYHMNGASWLSTVPRRVAVLILPRQPGLLDTAWLWAVNEF